MKKTNKFATLLDTMKTIKALGIIVSIAMIIMGIITMFSPILGQRVSLWMMVVGLIIYGVEEIISFFTSPKAERSGFLLALGILWLLLGLSLFSSIYADAVTELVALGAYNLVLATMVSFGCIVGGINNFCLCKIAEEYGRSKGLLIASGILSILCGLFILAYPIGSVITLEIFFAIFLFCEGVSLLCDCLSFKIK